MPLSLADDGHIGNRGPAQWNKETPAPGRRGAGLLCAGVDLALAAQAPAQASANQGEAAK